MSPGKLATSETALLAPVPWAAGEGFVPVGASSADPDYLAEEWVATGIDDLGLPYRTQVYLHRPRDMARFSGVVFVEALHADRIAPIYMYSANYLLREGHGWACVVSQKCALDQHLKAPLPQLYGEYAIGTDFHQPLPSRPSPVGQDGDLFGFITHMARINRSSGIILAQVGTALRNRRGPFGDGVRSLLLAGHSQTGWVATDYIRTVHHQQRLLDGAPIFDGFFPAGFPREAFGNCDVPIIQVLSDGDVFDAGRCLLRADRPGRHYRRPDSDEADNRYRLYELASFPHYGTRYPPANDPKVSGPRQGGLIKPTDIMNSLPYDALFNVALDHLVRWARDGIAPPRAPRIETEGGGRLFAKDMHGNSRGGVRCVQLDVPRATYRPVPCDDDGEQAWATVGTEIPFSPEKMRALYGTPEDYRRQFNARLDELIAQGWLLEADAPNSRKEAARQSW